MAKRSYSRFVFRFAKDWTSYDTRRVDNITPTGLNFTVLPKGLCVCLTEDEKIEIFSNQKDHPSSQRHRRSGDSWRYATVPRAGDNMRFAQDTKLYSFAVKK
jgi:hypothetical protein